MVVLTAAAVTTLLLTNKSDADAAVASAVTSAINDRTAIFSLNGSIAIAGHSIPVVGFGQTDFTQNALQMLMKIDASSFGDGDVTEDAIYLDKVMYLNAGDLVGNVLPGKSWLSLDLSQLNGGNGALGQLGVGGSTMSNDPVETLKVLGEDGNHATDLGPSTVNGQPVEGYSVSVDPAAIRAQMANEHLPSWMRQAVSSVSNPHETYKVYVNKSGELAGMTTNASMTVGGQSVTESISMDFSKYGSPVNVTAPPAEQVASFGSFFQAADAQASSSST